MLTCIVKYDILAGRNPNRKDMIHTKSQKFDSFADCSKWMSKTFEPNSVWWISYWLIIEDDHIRLSSKVWNSNLKYIDGNYVENRNCQK